MYLHQGGKNPWFLTAYQPPSKNPNIDICIAAEQQHMLIQQYEKLSQNPESPACSDQLTIDLSEQVVSDWTRCRTNLSDEVKS